MAAFLSSFYLEKEIDNGKLRMSQLSLTVEKLLKKMSVENCKLPLENLMNLLPTYELEIDNSTKVLFAFQAHIFHYKTGNFLLSIPETYDPKKRQIYLVSDMLTNNTQILYYIASLNKYFQKFGKFCFYCKKNFTSRGCNHRCSQVRLCFACKRPFLEVNTFITRENKSHFCNSNLFPSPTKTCTTCNIFFLSQECFEEHKKKVCRWGWKCPKCNIFQGRNGFFKTQEEIKRKHICGQRFCNFCGELKEIPHFCTLKKHKAQKEFTNLAFVSFLYSGFNVSKCKTCYTQNNGKPCQNCPSHTELPLSCIILQEGERRDFFSSHIIHDNSIEDSMKLVPIQNNPLYFSYIPSFVEKTPKLAPEGRITRFGKRTSKTKCKDIFRKEKMSLLDKFFDYLMQNNFSNSTIFLYSGVSQDMFFILQGLLDNGLSPNVVKNHNHIKLIEEKKLSLRFVEIQNYFHSSFRDLCHRVDQPMPYFPLQWVQKSFFSYNGKPPNLNDLFDFEDTEKDLEEKKEYVSKLAPLNWNFKKEYILYLTKRVKISAIVMLDFLKEAFYCQNVILKHFKHSSESWTYLHPVNPPIFTAASYSFQMFLHMTGNSSNIRTIHNPIPFNSSKGEVQYIMYIMSQNPNEKFTMAWSPEGQKSFGYTKPDAISGNQVWYYNGCFYHGHSKEKCKFKTKETSEARHKKELEFNQKIEKLKKENPAVEITVMWECMWRSLKQKDKDVKYFLKNIYRNPPLSRLNPREAGKIKFVVTKMW